MLDDIVYKSQKHHQEITRTPPFHFNSAACLLAPSLPHSLQSRKSRARKEIQRNSTTTKTTRKKKKKKKKGESVDY
jgi:hypothetical protein